MTAELTADGDTLAALPGVHGVRHHGRRVTFEVDDGELPAVVSHLATLGLRSLESQPPTLEQLFLRHYGEELSDAGVEA